MKIIIRNAHNYNGKGEYIGRPTPLCNPENLHNESDRDRVCDLYHETILYKIKENDEEVIKELDRLYDILISCNVLTLICWCKPKRCHGDTIKELLTNRYYTGRYIS